MKVLIVSNMRAKRSAPLQGLFVDKQVISLKKIVPNISYYKLPWNGETLWHTALKYPWFFLVFIKRYVFTIKRFDIIHVHYYFPTIICAVLYRWLRNSKVEIIVTCHGSDIYSFSPPSWLYKVLSQSVDLWIFTSKLLKSKFYRTTKNNDVICAGYDDDNFSSNVLNLHEKTIDCLFVGSLDKNKGVDRFLYLVKELPHVTFAAVGSGALANMLQTSAENNNNLLLLGSKNAIELAKIMKNAKCLLSLSYNESFGLVMTEAHACSTPCIATMTDGSKEQLPQWPYLVEQYHNNEQKTLLVLKEKIMSLLTLTPEHYLDLQIQAQKTVSNYSLTHVSALIAAQYERLYHKSKNENQHV